MLYTRATITMRARDFFIGILLLLVVVLQL